MIGSASGRIGSRAPARVPGRSLAEWSAAAILALGLAAGAWAQAGPPQKPPMPRPGPMRGVFSFVEPLSDVSARVVKDAPFSAVVVRETVEQLADGNRIDRKSTGTIARDDAGRTRREMTLENIGPWAAEGKAPRLVFINDPVAGKIYTLDENRKIAYEIPPPPKVGYAPRREGHPPEQRRRAHHWREFRAETQRESLGEKKMDGILVKGVRIVRTIPAGQIGNEKPIVIVTERWYSPRLHTTILLKRSDPRFGITIFRLTKVRLAEPPASLFVVPSGYTVKLRPLHGRMRRVRVRGRPPHGNP